MSDLFINTLNRTMYLPTHNQYHNHSQFDSEKKRTDTLFINCSSKTFNWFQLQDY